jgi:formate-dependent phosphoribosylglycinamide formyltransferase (GAR transformylase)
MGVTLARGRDIDQARKRAVQAVESIKVKLRESLATMLVQ